MKHDPLTQYISLRDALLKEKAALEQRLREISQVFGSDQSQGDFAAATSPPSTPGRGNVPLSGRRSGRRGNPLSLREAVIEVLTERPLGRREIIEAVQALGYRFASKDPLNSLGMVLYGKNPRFKNVDGRYIIEGRPPAKAAPYAAPATAGSYTPARADSGPYRQRRMSNQAREKLRAIARARWARAKAQGRSAL